MPNTNKHRLSRAERRLSRSFGWAVGAMRRIFGHSQTSLARELGSSQSHISEIETGNHDLLISTAVRLGWALGATGVEMLLHFPYFTLEVTEDGVYPQGWRPSQCETTYYPPVVEVAAEGSLAYQLAAPWVVAHELEILRSQSVRV
jgi:transcriptional regulator with XRE-family HTH domain